MKLSHGRRCLDAFVLRRSVRVAVPSLVEWIRVKRLVGFRKRMIVFASQIVYCVETLVLQSE